MILSNQVECLKCGDKPFSRHRHDYQTCKCGNVSVDGGMDYTRRCCFSYEWRDISIEWSDDLVDDLKEAIDNAKGCNNLGLICRIAVAMRDAGYTITKEV
jgi:hypothetical protein